MAQIETRSYVEPEESRLSFVALLNVLLRRRRQVVLVTLLIATAVVVVTLITREQVARATFAPNTPATEASRLAGFAAQFGVVMNESAGETLDFYAQLVRSRELLWEVATTEYRFPQRPGAADSLGGRWVDLAAIEADVPEGLALASVKELTKNVGARVSRDANTVTVEVRAPWGGLAEQMCRRILNLLNDFNLERRQSRATAERAFVEERMADAERALALAETDLQAFLEENRQFEASPRLRFEAERHERRVDLSQQIYLSLRQAYEKARIDEVRNTPVITVIDAPEGYAEPSVRLLTRALLGLGLGGILAMGIAFAMEHAAQQQRQFSQEYRDLAVLGREAGMDLIRLPRTIAGGLLRRPGLGPASRESPDP